MTAELSSMRQKIGNSSWLRGTNAFFAEYVLFLILLGVTLWVFDSLVFAIFSLIADRSFSVFERMSHASLIAAAITFVPFLLVIWKRVRNEEATRTGLSLRRAYRIPLYIFLILQALTFIGILYIGMNSIISSFINGFDDFGLAILTFLLPAILTAAVHASVLFSLLKRTRGFERKILLVLAGSVLAMGFILLLAQAVDTDKTNELETGGPGNFDDRRWNEPDRSDEQLENWRYFEY